MCMCLCVCMYACMRVNTPNTCSSLWRGPQEYIAYEFILTSPAACLVHLTWMVIKMGSRWLYTYCFVGCCFQDLFTACSILVQLPSSFFSKHLVSVLVVHPYSSIGMTAAWKKLFILLGRSDFHKTKSSSIAVLAITSCVLMSFSVDETLLPK